MKIRNGLVADVLIWFTLAASFLTAYIGKYSFSTSAIIPHLRVSLIFFLLIAAMRMTLALVVANRRIERIMAAAFTGTLLLIALTYYGLVLIGLEYWNRVISLELIWSYAGQLPGLLDALGMSMAFAVTTAVLAIAVAIAVVYFYFGRFDWSVNYRGLLSTGWWALAICSAVMLLACEVYRFHVMGVTGDDEPVAMTVYPRQGSRMLQSYAIDRHMSQASDVAEQIARTNYRPIPIAKLPNLVLIVVDALRPSNMGVYGYPRDTTPFMARLTHSHPSIVVGQVRASCGESACGITSLLTSKYVHQFSAKPFSLYEILRRYGYRIHLILGGDHTHFYGLKEIYGTADSYFDSATSGEHVFGKHYFNDDQLVVDRANGLPEWDGNPTALHFHLMSAHALGTRKDKWKRYLPAANYALPQNRGEDRRQEVVNFYDNGVLQTDAMIELLVNALGSKHYLDNALIVVTADHGEALGEHGLFGHAHGVWDEVIRIPLLFVQFGNSEHQLEANHVGIRQIDIAPSILYHFGMPEPESWAGIPLQRTESDHYQYFAQGTEVGFVDLHEQRTTWKVWFDRERKREYVFDISDDPKERSNLNMSVQVNGTRNRNWTSRIMRLPPVLESRFFDQN